MYHSEQNLLRIAQQIVLSYHVELIMIDLGDQIVILSK